MSSKSKILGLGTNGDPRTFVGVDCFSSSFRLAKIFTSLEVGPSGVGGDMVLEPLTVPLNSRMQKLMSPD